MSKIGGEDDIPTGWVRTNLSQLGDLHCGQSPSTSHVNRDGNGIAYISGPEHWDGFKLHLDKWTTQPKRRVPNGCIFVTVKGAGVGTIFPGVECAIGRDIYAFEPRPGVSARFVEFAIRATVNDVIWNARGDIPGLSKSHILDHEILVPGQAMQERIAAKIDELFSDIEAGEKALERAALLVKRYRQSVLKTAVTGELTKEWRAKHLARLKKQKKTGADLLAEILEKRRESWEAAELAKLTANGKSPKGDRWKQRYVEPQGPNFEEFMELPDIPDGWTWACVGQIGDVSGGLTKNAARKSRPLTRPYLRVANVYANRLKLDEVLNIELAAGELDRVTLQSGDLLVVEGNGSPDQIGRVALWDGSIPNCVHQNHLIKIRFMESSYARHVLQWLLSGDGRACIGKVASSTSGLHTLSISKIERLPVPVPPLEELVPIANCCDESDTQASHSADELTQIRRASKSLEQAVLRSAFSGRLVAQDPDDEPAAVLLERLQAEREGQKSNAGKSNEKPTKKMQRRGRPKKATGSSDRQGKLC